MQFLECIWIILTPWLNWNILHINYGTVRSWNLFSTLSMRMRNTSDYCLVEYQSLSITHELCEREVLVHLVHVWSSVHVWSRREHVIEHEWLSYKLQLPLFTSFFRSSNSCFNSIWTHTKANTAIMQPVSITNAHMFAQAAQNWQNPRLGEYIKHIITCFVYMFNGQT